MEARVKVGRLPLTGVIEAKILSGTPGAATEARLEVLRVGLDSGTSRRISSEWVWPKRARRTMSALAARMSARFSDPRNIWGLPAAQMLVRLRAVAERAKPGGLRAAHPDGRLRR